MVVFLFCCIGRVNVPRIAPDDTVQGHPTGMLEHHAITGFPVRSALVVADHALA